MPYLIRNINPPKELLQWADQLIELVGIGKVAKNRATDIPGGQQQRTAIARALINKPPIILADEPTGNLDSESTENIYNIIRKINKEHNTTFIIITHDQRIAEKTDRICLPGFRCPWDTYQGFLTLGLDAAVSLLWVCLMVKKRRGERIALNEYLKILKRT